MTEGNITLSWPTRRDPQPLPAPSLTARTTIGAAPNAGRPNLLIHADNLHAIAHAAAAQRRKELPPLSLIYIDPPFAMESHHRIGAEVAYSDCWGDPANYLQFMLDRLAPMRDLLAPDGVLALHCDWRANSWLRLLLDELLGRECFRNQIIWRRAPNLGHQATARQLGRTIDTILVYSRTPNTAFRGTVPTRSTAVELTRTGRPRGSKWDPDQKVWFTTAPRGDYTDASIAALRAQGRVYEPAGGKVYIKYPLRQGEDGRWYKDQPVDTLWTDEGVRPLRHCTKAELEIGYPTQKPEALLRRIIEWTTKPGDTVADFFCGSGTTLAVATKLGRQWIGCDQGTQAIEVASRRLAALVVAAKSCAHVLAADSARPASVGARPIRAAHIRGTASVSTPGTA